MLSSILFRKATLPLFAQMRSSTTPALCPQHMLRGGSVRQLRAPLQTRRVIRFVFLSITVETITAYPCSAPARKILVEIPTPRRDWRRNGMFPDRSPEIQKTARSLSLLRRLIVKKKIRSLETLLEDSTAVAPPDAGAS